MYADYDLMDINILLKQYEDCAKKALMTNDLKLQFRLNSDGSGETVITIYFEGSEPMTLQYSKWETEADFLPVIYKHMHHIIGIYQERENKISNKKRGNVVN